MSPPAQLIAGDPRHGVVRLAADLADEIERVTGVAKRTDRPPERGAAHLHFTDRLWGPDPETAAERIARLATGLRLTVTLHDLPQPSDGARRLPRRATCYRRVVSAADGVVCNSRHEAALMAEMDLGPEPEAVIALPAPRPPPGGPRPTLTPEVALLGFVYPGKGHAEAIDACAALGRGRLSVVALGAVADGHAGELRSLTARAEAAGLRFVATGWLSDIELVRRCRHCAVPLAAHRHISASGSITSWIAAGRQALVTDSRYAREIEALRPGTIRRVDPAGLAEAIDQALVDPPSTWLAPGTDTRPHLRDAALAYLRWWAAR